ncbi:MAG: HAMP domain-containing histidine kinase [Caulobacteraceae bacterium]|jgi:signal transduction histidine kinase|nr:HAMP domain-containing histidine kinase [Caulobacteraceae bacterium]MDX5392687.1 HAMP domain-containing histidine kinase [Caulobacteraceae bacterium]
MARTPLRTARARAVLETEPGARPDKRAEAIRRLEARAEDERRSFLRMASHELRTPLNSILGFSELIAGEIYGPVGAPEYKTYAELIRDSGRKLLTLANQVIEIARLESGAADLVSRREPLDHILDDVIDSLTDEIRRRRTDIHIAGQGGLPDVMVDPKGVRTALSALIGNGVTHGPENGRMEITVATADGAVHLEIRDQGPGIAPRDVPRLLRPFEQGENALVRRGEGAGLGLPLAAMLCRGMGGALTLSPGETGGLRVQVRLVAAD